MVRMDQIEIGMLDADELPAAIAVLARGLRDNPLPMALFGRDPERRRRELARLLGEATTVPGWPRHWLIARHMDGAIVGVCGVLPPGECGPDAAPIFGLLRGDPRAAPRSTVPAWQREAPAVVDPLDHHWRLGPVTVEASRRGVGIGGALVRVACARIDAAGDDACLETDHLAIVGFFAHFGFAVTGERQIAGVPTWRMRRHPEPGHLVGPISRPPFSR